MNIIFFGLQLAELKSQLSRPCLDDEIVSAVCDFTCLLCDINGWGKRADCAWVGIVDEPDCNVSFTDAYSFVAMSSNIDIQVTLSDCIDTEPGEVEDFGFFGVYEDADSVCYDGDWFTDIRLEVETNLFISLENLPVFRGQYRIEEGEPQIFRNINPLTIGNIYIFNITAGGGGETNCRYDLQILQGSTAVPELDTPLFAGLEEVCLGEEASYALVSDSLPITRFAYTIDGDTVGQSAVLNHRWVQAGSFELCLSASNYCSFPPPSCRTITVYPPETVADTAYFCEASAYEILPDSFVFIAANYQLNLQDNRGCDSTVLLQLIEIPRDTQQLSVTLCLGDTLRLSGNRFFTPGQHTFTLSNQQGCDSTIIIALDYTVCNLLHETTLTHPLCFGEASGTIRWQMLDGTPPYSYVLTRLGSSANQGGSIPQTGENITINGLAAGDYLIDVSDVFGNRIIFQASLDNPPILENNFAAENLLSNSLRCHGDENAVLRLSINGGTPPYEASWSTGLDAFILASAGAGLYSVRIADINGCMLEDSYEITEPDPLAISVIAEAESCDEAGGDGALVLQSISGGTPPYQSRLFNFNGALQSDWERLFQASYRLEVEDSRGCRLNDTIIITEPLRPRVDLWATPDMVSLGQQIRLQTQISQADSLFWGIPDIYDYCQDCDAQSLLPLDSDYFSLRVFSPDGCEAIDSVYVRVIPDRKIFFPTAFSPNYDGINDYFFPYAGPNVSEITSLEIYDRWGGMVFKNQAPIIPNQANSGWDGLQNNKIAAAGVYAWKASVRFLDGEVLPFQGAVVLLR